MFRAFRDPTPCWYDLSWNQKKCAIILKIHEDFVQKSEELNLGQETPFVASYTENFDFQFFNGNFKGDFGFEGSFKFKGLKDSFCTYEVSLPIASTSPCQSCGVQLEFDFPKNEDYKCFDCSGKRIERRLDWKKARAISATFTLFFWLPFEREKPNSSNTNDQLILLRTITQRGTHGGSLGGEYLYPMGKWLKSIPPHTELTFMKEAMISAHEKMFAEKLSRLSRSCDFRANIAYEGGWLNASCPGDACGIHPEADITVCPDRIGYCFASHNVDTPFQQLTFLVGLAALCDEARKNLVV